MSHHNKMCSLINETDKFRLLFNTKTLLQSDVRYSTNYARKSCEN